VRNLPRHSAQQGQLSWGANRRNPPMKNLWLAAFLVLLLGSFCMPQTPQGLAEPSASMDQAIALLTEARLHFQNVRDYQCRLTRQERVNGILLPKGVMTMKVRNKPLSVYLYCESPDADKGMEVCYVEGRNQGMMRVHPPHLLGILGFWSVGTHDARALEKNRHCITEAGFGTLLESTARYWDRERRLGKTLVYIKDEELSGRMCNRIETVHPDRHAGSYYGYRCVLWLDKATHLPAGAETFDWPRRGGSESGDLLEWYRYSDVRCNIGLSDGVFSH
jgi:hypothetical protein